MTLDEKEMVEKVKRNILEGENKSGPSFSALNKVVNLVLGKIDRFFIGQNEKKMVGKEQVDEDEVAQEEISVTLPSLFPNKEIQDRAMKVNKYFYAKQIDDAKKMELSSYLGIDKEEIVLLDWNTIDDLILKKIESNGPKLLSKINFAKRKM